MCSNVVICIPPQTEYVDVCRLWRYAGGGAGPAGGSSGRDGQQLGPLIKENKEATMAIFWSNKAYLFNLYPLDETDNQPESSVDTRTEWCFAIFYLFLM
jgi:hypothetical protein